MMNMKLYMTPGSCTTGIHILMEELDLVFEAHLVNLLNNDHKTPEYMAMNPKSNIPVLITNEGSVITEFQAIAYWLARRYPKAGLLSDNLDDEIRIIEMMDYVVATVHMQGFARIFTTDKFTPNESDYEWVKQQGREIIDNAFAVINQSLKDKDYIVNQFSIADAALFYVEFWADKIDIAMPDHCQAHYMTMLKRQTVRQVLMEEGYTIS
jgi:glutathione S-transferase